MSSGRLAIDHVGLTVPDLNEAVEFFVDVFGCEFVFEAGPYENVGYFWDGEDAPEAATVRLAILTHNGTHNIELLEYTNKPRKNEGTHPRPSDPGGYHLAFYVEDIVATVERLRQRPGVRFLGEIDHEVGTPISGTDWIYTQTPWGLVIELMSYQPGLPYESTTDKRVVLPPWLRSASPHVGHG
ncbi:VOC family protein [Mycolicibacterium setense]|jgi:catechol 2,3-dioxygenase-like lactoylglutathione lyase family enzyme